jgi:signal transduction histidine kinase/ActR/RegA family two-component response regulator
MSSELSIQDFKVQAAVSRWFTEDARQGFFVTDTRFRLVMWNRWMEIHAGYSASSVVGRPLFDLYPDAIARGIQEYYENALAGRVTVLSHGLHRHLLPLPPTNVDLTFNEMPQSGHIGPLVDGDTVIGTVTVLEDVSDRLASEAELRRQIEAQQLARATAEKALRAKDDFLSTLSHEIRTPLNAVLGWARILLGRDDIDRELLDRALHVIERNAAAQKKIIDDMLDMARIVAGKLRLEMQPVDLLSVVLAAVDVVMPSATAKRITLHTSLDPKTPRVLGDQDRLQQVIWNLLSNALKFTPSGGTIDVRLAIAGKSARIVVSDTGQGITQEFLPEVFERFRQNDASSARRHGGLGLGLALVHELVELHGGTVSAASEGHNKGATFTIDLPTVVSPEIRRNHLNSKAFSKGNTRSLTGVRILVVDDETDARDLAVTALEQCGAEVTAVPSSSDALAALLAASADTLPDVLVSDIGMPREDGYDLIRRVRSLQPERGGRIPAVTVTGYATPEDVDRALAAGYQVHVAKPMDPAALVTAVADLVEAHRRNQII